MLKKPAMCGLDEYLTELESTVRKFRVGDAGIEPATSTV